MKNHIFQFIILYSILLPGWRSFTYAQSPIQYGVFVDSRDGQTYNTITVNGLKWMAQNLNYPTRSSYSNGRYGRLYNANDARTACPRGWRLPYDYEWAQLTIFFGGYGNLGQQIQWMGHNPSAAFRTLYIGGNSGFNAVPSGEFSSGQFRHIGNLGHYWSGNMGSNGVIYRFIQTYQSVYRIQGKMPTDAAFACRCVADPSLQSTPVNGSYSGDRRPAPRRNIGASVGVKPKKTVRKNTVNGRKPQPRPGRNTGVSRRRPTSNNSYNPVSAGRTPKASLTMVLNPPCRTCVVTQAILVGANRSAVRGKLKRNGTLYTYSFYGVRPGKYEILVEGENRAGGPRNTEYHHGKADLIKKKIRMSYQPRFVNLIAGKHHRLNLRSIKPLRR